MSARTMLSLVGAAAVIARAATAQSIEASATTFTVQSHVLFGSTRAEQTGQWMGGEGWIGLGKVRLGLAGALGSLNGSAGVIHPDRRGRVSSVTLHGEARWFAFGPTIEAKRFDTDFGPTVWRLIGANAQIAPRLGSNAVEALVDVTYWPSAAIVDGGQMSLAFRAVIGATYQIAASPVRIRLAYRFERFDFDAQGSSARLEQFRGATLGAVIRLHR